MGDGAAPPHPHVNAEPEGPSPRQDAAIAAHSHRNPLPELDTGSPFLARGSHPNTALPHECESRPACRKPPKRPLLPGPPCHRGMHQQLCGLDGPLHWEGPRGLGRRGLAQGAGHTAGAEGEELSGERVSAQRWRGERPPREDAKGPQRLPWGTRPTNSRQGRQQG